MNGFSFFSASMLWEAVLLCPLHRRLARGRTLTDDWISQGSLMEWCNHNMIDILHHFLVFSSHPTQLCLYDHLHLSTLVYKKPDIICNQQLHFSPVNVELTWHYMMRTNLCKFDYSCKSKNSKCHVLLLLASKAVESTYLRRLSTITEPTSPIHNQATNPKTRTKISLQDYRSIGRTAHTVLLGVGKLW